MQQRRKAAARKKMAASPAFLYSKIRNFKPTAEPSAKVRHCSGRALDEDNGHYEAGSMQLQQLLLQHRPWETSNVLYRRHNSCSSNNKQAYPLFACKTAQLLLMLSGVAALCFQPPL